MQWYARQVANNPCYVIFIIILIATTLLFVCVYYHDLPDFRDPLVGFEARGTELSDRSIAWENLLKTTGWNGPLTFYPGNIVMDLTNETLETAQWRTSKINKSSPDGIDIDDPLAPSLELETDEHAYGFAEDEEDEDVAGHIIFERPYPVSPNRIIALDRKNFFCNNPTREYAHVVLQSTSGKNLFTVEGLRAICDIDQNKLRKSKHFSKLCEIDSWGSCCHSWSLPNYIALLRNLSSCKEIKQSDVSAVLQLLASCSNYYYKMKLSHDCMADPGLCRKVPRQCFEHDAVYNIFHYLADTNFLNPKSLNFNVPKLEYTAIFLPTAQSHEALSYYKDLEKMNLCNDIVEVVGMELGLKYKLFVDCLLHDTVYVAMAGLMVFILLWLYSSSFFITFMTLLSVVFSLSTAYFMYTFVYGIPFFPFINLLTVIIIIGIGADDACIYCKIWTCSKSEKNNGTLTKLVRDTLHHACLSMFITSITTSGAFFASYINNITAIQCFSIFAGTAVLANFIFTLFWLPASVILSEKWCSSSCCLCIPPLGLYLPQFQQICWCSSLCNTLWRLHYSFTDSSRVFFEKILPCIIVKSRYVWIALFSVLASGAAIVVFYYPKLQLPSSRGFQIFDKSHPFEKYDLFLKNMFWFERAKEHDLYRKLPIKIVWGVLPIDNGHHLDPLDRGQVVFDPSFDIASPLSQVWLHNFCIQLRNQSFYQPTHGVLMFNCFIDTFKDWMERRCVDGISDTNRMPCCETSKFPFSESVFNHCIKEAVSILHHTPGYFAAPTIEGIRFSKSTGKVAAIVVQYDSIYSFSNSYIEMHEFQTCVNEWVAKMMSAAPKGLRNGWFISDLEFYDLQDSLSSGSLLAIGVAVAVSFIALLLTTLNLLISIYAILTIACVIIVTVGSLVLLGWKLNVLESTTVSIAIGLAIDLTLHYGVAYRLSPQEDRESSIICTLSRVGSPVAMAAFTTFMAGAMVFPSIVLAYLQIGTFLVVLMSVSWLYSTFFFLSLLSAAGPQDKQLQLNYPSFKCCETTSVPVEKNVYALSESTLSSSSASYPNQIPTSESHELEPLTAGRIDVPKFVKKKHSARSIRPRSGSLSSAAIRTRDPVLASKINRTLRKVSLPTVSITFHGETCPDTSIGAASSSTIICADEEKETQPLSKEDISDVWVRKEISV